MRLGPARGTALRQHVVITRFESGCRPGPKPGAKLAPRVAEIRKLLRTEMSLQEIADAIGSDADALRRFIKCRQLCNLRDRMEWIKLQRSLRTLDATRSL